MNKNVTVLLALLFLIATCISNMQPVKAESREFIVTNVDQLMDAINEAAHGDIIIVKSGIYDTPQDQTVKISRSISLIGEDANSTRINLHPANVIVGWNSIYPVYEYNNALWIIASDAKISGLTISSDGGVILATGSRIQITNSKIENYISATGQHQNISQNTIIDGIDCGGSFNTVAENRFLGGEVSVRGFANVIYDNVIANGAGITLVDYNYTDGANQENTFFNNTVKNCDFGLRVWPLSWQTDDIIVYHNYNSQNIVYHNNFISNNRQVGFRQVDRWTFEYRGFLDNGIEGNYWSDYAGNDGNGDGIGDSPYVIDANNTDRHPLMYPWGAPDVSVKILENATYKYLPLVFSVAFSLDKRASWIGYSLDGQDNVTIAGIMPLTGLSSGLHNITVYALDVYGVGGASETINFTVAKEPEPFPVVAIVAASTVTIVLVGVGVLVYFKKHKAKTD